MYIRAEAIGLYPVSLKVADRKIELGDRPMVGHTALDRGIRVRPPVSQLSSWRKPTTLIRPYLAFKFCVPELC